MLIPSRRKLFSNLIVVMLRALFLLIFLFLYFVLLIFFAQVLYKVILVSFHSNVIQIDCCYICSYLAYFMVTYFSFAVEVLKI